MASTHKRGTAFRLEDLEPSDDNEHNVQFVTPYYEEPAMPEPLDLSKLCLDDDLFEKDETEATQQDAELQTRGRSRSRSVHENDIAAADLIPVPELTGVTPVDQSADAGHKGKKSGEDKASRRGGPLQQREVQALKKGLEEANQSLNKNQSREDEEERMAADAEKRKRLLQANSAASSSGGAAAARRVKLLMLGDSGVGKSSLIMRWTLDTFSPSLVSTVGVNFKSRKVNIGSEAVQVQVWDTAGQEQFHKITTSYYKGAQGIMLVYDVTDLASLANIEYWIKNIKSHATDTVQVALIGNKTDLRPASGSPSHGEPTKKCCETARGQEIAHKYGIPFFETSAKESSNVEIAFLTLVEHIVESGGGGAAAGPHSPAAPGLGHAAAQGAAHGGNGTSAGAGKSIVEKASEKARMFSGAFKRTASTTAGKSSPPSLPSPTNGSNGSGSGSGGVAPDGSAVGADGEDKEKCVIS